MSASRCDAGAGAGAGVGAGAQPACGVVKLTARQRVTLVTNTSTSHEAAMAMDDAELDFSFFVTTGVSARNLRAAKLTPRMLEQRGAKTARHLRQLGYDALDLSDGQFCSNCVAIYGATDLLSEFLITPADAVSLAGSPATRQLGLDVGTLLVVCAGAPEEARSVLEQTLPRGGALVGVAPSTLLDTGLRGGALTRLGYTPSAVCAQTMASASDLELLGF